MKYPKTFWDERYGSESYVYGHQPNHFFQEQLTVLAPGRILMPAEGEGRNGVFAARQGWEVSAFDLSEVGRRKALDWASENGVSLDYQVIQAEEVTYPTGHFDALGLIFANFGASHRPEIHQKLLTFLKPGGWVIFESYSKEQLEYQKRYNSGGPQNAEMLFSEAEIRSEFAGLEFVRLEKTEVVLQEGTGHQGPASMIRFVGRKV